ncbi:MAG: hypothetical protein WBD31_18690 [Rubripirellula sp.]
MFFIAEYVHWVVTSIALTFLATGTLILWLAIKSIRSGEVTIYGSTVNRKSDPFSYFLNIGFGFFAAGACFYITILLVTVRRPNRDDETGSPSQTPTVPRPAEVSKTVAPAGE